MIGGILSWSLRIIIFLISMSYLLSGDLFAAILTLVGFFLTLGPLIMNAWYNVRLHWIFEVSVSFIMFWHIFGFFGAYDAFEVWDDFGHVFGGAVLALIGFAWLYSLNVSKKVKLTLPMIGFISVTWSATAGVVWEIWEFLWDSAYGLVNVYGVMQNGLIDTMTDLSFDLIAAILMVLLCIYIVRNVKVSTTERVINPFVQILERKH